MCRGLLDTITFHRAWWIENFITGTFFQKSKSNPQIRRRFSLLGLDDFYLDFQDLGVKILNTRTSSVIKSGTFTVSEVHQYVWGTL